MDTRKDVEMHTRTQPFILEIRNKANRDMFITAYRIATRLYASGKTGAGVDGGVGATNRECGMIISSGGRAGRGAGALIGGVADELVHQGAGMSSARSGLVRRVLVSSEVGSCITRVKRDRSSGVNAAHILSAEALSTNF